MMASMRRVLASARFSAPPEAEGYQPVQETDDGSPDHVLSESAKKNAHDKGVYWCFWALGAGILLSWNVLICTLPLLASFFEPGSSHRTNLASYLSTTYCFGNLLFLGIAQRSVATNLPTPRIHYSLVLLLILSLLLTFPILPILLPSLSPSSPLILPLLLLLTALLSVSTAYLQSGVFALAALWGPTETLALMSGQGGIAVLVSGTQCLLAVISALRGGDESTEESSMWVGVGLWALGCAGSAGSIWALKYLVGHEGYARAIEPVLHRREQGQEGLGREKGRTGEVFRKNARLEVAVAWVFTVTLSVFPPLTTAIVSTHNPTPKLLQPGVFIPVHFLIFNLGDYFGRTYCPRPPFLPTSHRTVLNLSFARTIFIPLFLMCNISTSLSSTPPSSVPNSMAQSPLINSDLLYFLLILLFGLTNGWISSLCMILSSSPGLNPRITEDEKDLAGTLAVFCLVAGLAMGSAASFGVNWIVRGSFV